MRPARSGAAAMALALSVHAAQAQDAPIPQYVTDPALWGQVRRLTEPEYPKAALATGRSGYVDVRGRVSPLGKLLDVEYSAENSRAGVFIDPIRRVIASWEFQPPLGRDCQPSEERITNRVWFESRGGNPRVSVSLVRTPVPGGPQRILPLAREEPQAARGRRGGLVAIYARVVVESGGDVSSVEPRTHASRKDIATRELEHEVIRAVTQWRFAPLPEPGQAARRVCYDTWVRDPG